MAEPFKSIFDPALVAGIGARFAVIDPDFDRAGFVAAATDGLAALEFKARAARIADALEAHLPQDFPAACARLLAALAPVDGAAFPATRASAEGGLRGWAVMPLSEVVARRGLGHFARAMEALGEMTRRFSSEFAVRPFLAADPGRGMTVMCRWAEDPDPRLRRLASEGSRPRLPWGMRLAAFVADPGPGLALLERLKDDPDADVRRSVANHLNDIAKDHPDRAARVAADWLADAGAERRALVRHGMRGLVKAGHPGALAALGLDPAPVALVALTLDAPVVRFGGALGFAARLRLGGDRPRAVAVDYVIHHVKANGETRPKVFKGRVLSLEPGVETVFARRHPMRPITTRVYRDGRHRLEIVANGATLGGADFELTGAEGA